jgi:hypothetical protein
VVFYQLRPQSTNAWTVDYYSTSWTYGGADRSVDSDGERLALYNAASALSSDDALTALWDVRCERATWDGLNFRVPPDTQGKTTIQLCNLGTGKRRWRVRAYMRM